MKKHNRFSFVKEHGNLADILTDHKLAALGDAYINFAYSLALSERKGQPSGAKVKGNILAEAFRRAGLREYMPKRVTRHMLADAAEALMVYAWIKSCIEFEECVKILCQAEDPIEGFSQLLIKIKERIMTARTF
ncbi:MAG: ribonuclease III family protein [Candidatus Bathyarchaeia archaeon]